MYETERVREDCPENEDGERVARHLVATCDVTTAARLLRVPVNRLRMAPRKARRSFGYKTAMAEPFRVFWQPRGYDFAEAGIFYRE
ncbi:hypothetical protein [Aeromicrobium sp. 179-A 4D2 NHS]|uniref:hypothetical protein n=1 Tax=Aeromicrobium sp. 179-A 4D2 NHS TaxID=3142375 RepID=UPI0039A196BA